jgi:hypothetical protein
MQMDAGDTVMGETEIEFRDAAATQLHERVCLAIRWAGIILSTTALGLVSPAFQ